MPLTLGLWEVWKTLDEFWQRNRFWISVKFNPDSLYLACSFSMFPLRFSMQVLSFSSISIDCEEQISAPRLAGLFSKVPISFYKNNVAIFAIKKSWNKAHHFLRHGTWYRICQLLWNPQRFPCLIIRVSWRKLLWQFVTLLKTNTTWSERVNQNDQN